MIKIIVIMTQKVNFKNIAIFLITSMITIVVGIYDKLAGRLNFLETFYIATMSIFDPDVSQTVFRESGSLELLSCSISAVPILALGTIIIVTIVMTCMAAGITYCGRI